ncbi:MAG: dienelactone hydrolase [Gracilibacter sp. BRH_c7a]|nr:MAG: dienelactone hydrolase [Gracilibacter sp. BRH_c7a]
MKESRIIRLKGMEFYAHHGVLEEERIIGQRFIVDVDIHLSTNVSMKMDQLSETVNYVEVYSIIQKSVEREQFRLIETLADSIGIKLLEQLDCTGVRVVVHKPNAPIPGVFKDVSVEITKEKQI